MKFIYFYIQLFELKSIPVFKISNELSLNASRIHCWGFVLPTFCYCYNPAGLFSLRLAIALPARASSTFFVVSLFRFQAVSSKIVDLLLYNKAVKQSTLLTTCMPDPLKKTHLKSLFEMLRVSQDISRICRDFCLFFTDLWDIWGLEMSSSAIICYSSFDFCNK